MHTTITIFVCIAVISFFWSIGSGSEKSKKLKELEAKNKELKQNLLELSIKQVMALNGMLENFAIPKEGYYIELSKVYKQCTDAGIDITILKQITPVLSSHTSKDDLKRKIMNAAVVLNDAKDFTDDELNEIIDKTLDSK